MWLLTFWIILYLHFLISRNNRTILYLPVVVILTKLSMQFVAFYEYNRAVILLNYTLILYVVLLSIIEIQKSKNRFLHSKYLKSRIYIFILLVFVLAFINSSKTWESLKLGVGIIASLLAFSAMYNRRITESEFNLGIKNIVISLALFSLNFGFLTLLKLGPSLNEFSYMEGYSDSVLRTGTFGFFELHGFIILSSLVLFYRDVIGNIFWKNASTISSLVIIVMTILTFKRTYIAVIAFGILAYYILKVASSKNKIIVFILSLLSIGVLYFIFNPLIDMFLKARESQETLLALSESGRALEFLLYPSVVMEQKNPVLFFLFGKEIFTSSGVFSALNYGIQKGRFLHNDYAHILYGTGIVGLFLYLSIIISIVKNGTYYLKNKSIKLKTLGVGSIIHILGIFVSGLGDGILSFHNRVIPFFAIGLFLSAAKTKLIDEYDK